jgi:hypothetical protein
MRHQRKSSPGSAKQEIDRDYVELRRRYVLA